MSPEVIQIIAAIAALLPQVSQEIIAIIQAFHNLQAGSAPSQDQLDKLAAYSAALGGMQAVIDFHANS